MVVSTRKNLCKSLGILQEVLETVMFGYVLDTVHSFRNLAPVDDMENLRFFFTVSYISTDLKKKSREISSLINSMLKDG